MVFLRKESKILMYALSAWILIIYVLFVSVQRLEERFHVIDTARVEQVKKVIVNTVDDKEETVGDIFCIGAVVMVRIYRGDKPELTTYEVEQWIRYMQYAGVDEVYLYDTYEEIGEKLEYWCRKLFDPKEVFYHDWHNNTPFDTVKTQVSAYQHSIDNYKNRCEWHIAVDIDEYPFVFGDTKPGFLKRFIKNVTSEYPDCVEISFPNYIFSGYPKDFAWLIERLQRRHSYRSNELDKPLYRARNISEAGIHHNHIEGMGQSIDIIGDIARMNHYWGARLQNWKPDTNETLSGTIKDSSIIPILKELKRKALMSNKMSAYVTNRFWNM